MTRGATACLLGCAFFILADSTQPAGAADTTNAPRVKIYDDTADGFKQVADAVAVAGKNHKRILLDFGYNGCYWCQKLHELFQNDKAVRAKLKAGYVVVYIDWSRTHNEKVDAKYEARTLYGAPSLVILDSDGTKLVTVHNPIR